MIKILSSKWSVVHLQGIQFIILAIYIFSNADEVLSCVSIWFGLIILVAGILGAIAWLDTDELDREDMVLLWSFITVVFGIMILTNFMADMESIAIVYGLWMLVTGLYLSKTGWAINNRNSINWIMLIATVLSIVTAIIMVFNISSSAIVISSLLGSHVLISGIALLLLSFANLKSLFR